MLNSLGEEQSSRFVRSRLFENPQEEVLVQQVEEHESHEEEAIDDGRNDGIRKSFMSAWIAFSLNGWKTT